MSQKVTLSNADQRHLPKIKAFLLEGNNQLDISRALNLRRETVNRKIQRWMKTEDFEIWLKQVWMDLYGEIRQDDPKEVFRQVTKLIAKMMVAKTHAEVEGKLEVVAPWLNKFSSQETTINPTKGNSTST